MREPRKRGDASIDSRSRSGARLKSCDEIGLSADYARGPIISHHPAFFQRLQSREFERRRFQSRASAERIALVFRVVIEPCWRRP